MATNTADTGKQKALSMVLNQIERSFGKGAIMRLGDATRMRVETISTGALTLDLALGGGLPKGRVIEIYGPESSGKTTVALHAIAEVGNKSCHTMYGNFCFPFPSLPWTFTPNLDSLVSDNDHFSFPSTFFVDQVFHAI